MLGQQQGHRPVGVMIPEGQINERSNNPDLTIEHMMPIEFFAAQYVEAGKSKLGLFVYSGGKFYLAPNSQSWLSGMRELSPKLAKNAKEKYDSLKSAGQPVEAPTEDLVDVIAADEAPRTSRTTQPSPSDADIL